MDSQDFKKRCEYELLRENMALNIALSVVYVFSIFVQILQYSRRTGHSPQPES